MPVDWGSCEQDVLRLPKQFKSKFGGLKNLRADEWKAVIRAVRKRQVQGKTSDVYLNGRKLDPERLTREIRRYSKDCNSENLAGNTTSIDLGVDSPSTHRIEIKTSAQSRINPLLQWNTDIARGLMGNVEIHPSQERALAPEPTDVKLVPVPEIDLDFADFDFSFPPTTAMSPRFGFPDLQLPDQLSAQHSCLVSLSRGPVQSSITRPTLPYSPQPSLPFRSRNHFVSNGSVACVSPRTLSGIRCWQETSPILFWDLPGISNLIPAVGATGMLIPENEFPAGWGQKYERLPRGTKGWLLSYIVGVDPKLEALQPVADIVEELLRPKSMPFSPDTETYKILDGPSQQSSLCQIFALVAYLASNNMFEPLKLHHFLAWVLEKGFLKLFSRFLQMDLPCICAFRASVLRASISRLRPPQLEVAHLLMSLDPRICVGRFGGELLHDSLFGFRANLDIARLLVSHGADIDFVQNLRYSNHGSGTPLCRAVLGRSLNMIEYLIDAGCDVNKRFRTLADDGYETALTMAVQGGQEIVVKILLKAGAKLDDDNLRIECYRVMEFAMRFPRIYKLLQEKLGALPEICQLILAAEKGNRRLSQFLLEHNILHGDILERALCQAVKLGSRGAVRTLLQRGIDPDARQSRLDDDGVVHSPPILLALSHFDEYMASDIVYLLIKAGATIDDDILMQICQLAIVKGYTTVLYILADTGYNAALFGPSGLEFAACNDDIYGCGSFLDVGSPINAYGVKGQTGLQAAAKNDHLPLVQYLIDRGADVNFPASDNEGLTALQAAASGGHGGVFEYLIDAGADIRGAPAKKGGVTVLEAAASAKLDDECDDVGELFVGSDGEYLSTFKSLLALGAPVNRNNGTSGTVLHRLLRRWRIECAKLVLQAGAQVEDREPSRPMSTPLQVAAAEGQLEVIKLLLERGADINAPAGDEFGRTALQEATSAVNASLGIVFLLLSHGADVNAPPAARGGVTALQGAAIRGDIQISRLLLLYQADVNADASLEEGRTAVEGAAEHGRLDMVRLLLSVGAKADPVLGFSRAIQLAEENGHLVLADHLRDYEIASRLCDSLVESPCQPWSAEGIVFDEGLEFSI